MKGMALHHDAGSLGTAVPARAWERYLEELKAMGCNAIRTAHNPPSSEFLDLCDKMGFLVMDELFDEWMRPKIQGNVKYAYHLYFEENWKSDLTSFVLRDRNHPSVVMWSAGNEIVGLRKSIKAVAQIPVAESPTPVFIRLEVELIKRQVQTAAVDVVAQLRIQHDPRARLEREVGVKIAERLLPAERFVEIGLILARGEKAL